MKFSPWMQGFLVAILACAVMTTANAAVVGTITDGEDSGDPPVAGLNRIYTFGGWEKSVVTAADGNVHYKWVLPPQDQSKGSPANGVGPSWQLLRTDYEAALGHAVGVGTTLRFSAWVAEDAAAPMLGQGPWTDNIKFEFNSGVDGLVFGTPDQGLNLLPYGCDLNSGACTDRGTWDITTDWSLVSYTYEIGAADPIGSIDIIEPVVFIGDFTGGEYEQGTMYMDNIMVEVFDDLAAANATAIPNPRPGGIVPEPASGILVILGALALCAKRYQPRRQ